MCDALGARALRDLMDKQTNGKNVSGIRTNINSLFLVTSDPIADWKQQQQTRLTEIICLYLIGENNKRERG
jgi:hypothetical protein